MATLTRYATTHAAVSGAGWTSPGSVSADDNVYATAAPGKNATLSGDFGGFGFDTALDPTAQVSAVLVEVGWKVSATGVVGELLGAQAVVNGTAQAAETTTAGSTSEVIASQNPGVLTPAQLADSALRVRVRAARGNSNTAYTASLDFVRVTATYTIPPPAKNGAASVSGGGATASTGLKRTAGVGATSAGGGPSASGAKTARVAVALFGGGSLTAIGIAAGPALSGSVVLSGGGSVTATGRKGSRSSTATSCGGAVASTGAKVARAVAILTGGGDLATTGTAAQPAATFIASASLSGGGDTTTGGFATHAGAVTSSGGGALATTGVAARYGMASLNGGGELVAAGTANGAISKPCPPPGHIDPVSPGHVIQVEPGHVLTAGAYGYLLHTG